jgi:hypothetical protein
MTNHCSLCELAGTLCPTHGTTEAWEELARDLRAAIVENVRRQRLITSKQAKEILAKPLKGGEVNVKNSHD